jgi:tRNA(Ile)-lysidine synthase
MLPRALGAMESAVHATGLLDVSGARPLLVLCSAGRDSACLLDLAVRHLGADRVIALHIDHGLRPESAAEAAALHQRISALGARCVVRRATEPPRSGNLHAWARGQRRGFAADEALRAGAGAVAAAHTRTDLVETALFRLATQPGRRALLAMRDRQPAAFAGNVDLVRPLLVLTRDDTLAWCRGRQREWLDDASNADRRFARARLRHTVTPVLRSLNPRYEEAITRTLHELDEERAALDSIVAELLPTGTDAIAIAVLQAQPLALARLVVRELCERQIRGHCARASARTAELLQRASVDRRPFQLDVGNGARLEVRQGVLRCTASTGPAAEWSAA